MFLASFWLFSGPQHCIPSQVNKSNKSTTKLSPCRPAIPSSLSSGPSSSSSSHGPSPVSVLVFGFFWYVTDWRASSAAESRAANAKTYAENQNNMLCTHVDLAWPNKMRDRPPCIRRRLVAGSGIFVSTIALHILTPLHYTYHGTFSSCSHSALPPSPPTATIRGLPSLPQAGYRVR